MTKAERAVHRAAIAAERDGVPPPTPTNAVLLTIAELLVEIDRTLSGPPDGPDA